MEHFETEEQQVEAIKRFWKEYGLSIVGGAVIGLGSLWGWNYYQQQQLAGQEVASVAFENVLAQNGSADELAAAAAQFQQNYGDSGYAPLSDLMQARALVDEGKLAEAQTLLERAIGQLDNTAKPLAQLRLARVQQAQENLEGALNTVNAIDNAAFGAQRDELKGDLLVAKGDVTGARSAYQAALAAAGLQGNPAVQIKLDQLAQG
ncbi:YfgM family protein [Ferrimonas senticii]|uniref:YfgM family protein n=1 Tax=Ferrimonas senticii TaxID=394566 RepID=UPI000407D61A|nr:tetratricopeptide repeat protein [Ferrimonas senticii]